MSSRLTRRPWCIGLLLAFGAALTGCTSVTDSGSTTTANVPAIGQTAQAFGFSVLAQDFTFEDRYASPTQGDSVVVGLAVFGQVGGSALVEVADSTGTTLWQRTVTQSVAQGQTTVHGTPPYTVHLRFTGFSGVFALGVTAQP